MKRVYFIVFLAIVCIGLEAVVWRLGAVKFHNLVTPLPTKNNIAVPFTSQAPLGDWSEPWQNACEETAIVMVDDFYAGNQATPTQAAQKILRVISLKERRFGGSKDEDIQRIADLINSLNLNWSARVVVNPTVVQIKTELAASRPVILPVYAPDLHNPNYNANLPDYHVLVISGYDDSNQEFITQDPGTGQGKDLRFAYNVILNAMHDDLPTNYQAGRKAVIFTTKRIVHFGLNPIQN